MTRMLSILAVLVAGCTDAVVEPTWLAPDDTDAIAVGDAIELAVAADDDAVRTVRFAVDGVELAVCDPTAPDEDCRRDDVWRWTTSFAQPGPHIVTATLRDDDGAELATITRELAVVRELPDLAPDDDDQAIAAAGDAPATLEAANRGRLDPDRPYHSIFGGIAWRVSGQRVHLHTGTPQGSVADVARCMSRYGASIRHWADHYGLSRASVVATALTESSCTNPAGSSDGLSSGPMQVTGSTCAALTGLGRTTCRVRMHTQPDFSFHVGAMYMASSFQRRQHRHDPPKIAAAYNAGSLRKSSANRWHMLTTGNHIDRWVRAYNAYRAWEAK